MAQTDRTYKAKQDKTLFVKGRTLKWRKGDNPSIEVFNTLKKEKLLDKYFVKADNSGK